MFNSHFEKNECARPIVMSCVRRGVGVMLTNMKIPNCCCEGVSSCKFQVKVYTKFYYYALINTQDITFYRFSKTKLVDFNIGFNMYVCCYRSVLVKC